MNIIYRIQDAEGRGPFKPGFSEKWVETRGDHVNLKPNYDEFPLIALRFKEKAIAVGCETVEQLRRWFTKSEYETLLGYGYQAVRIANVDIRASSETQCLFTRNQSLTRNVHAFDLYGKEKN